MQVKFKTLQKCNLIVNQIVENEKFQHVKTSPGTRHARLFTLCDRGQISDLFLSKDKMTLLLKKVRLLTVKQTQCSIHRRVITLFGSTTRGVFACSVWQQVPVRGKEKEHECVQYVALTSCLCLGGSAGGGRGSCTESLLLKESLKPYTSCMSLLRCS